MKRLFLLPLLLLLLAGSCTKQLDKNPKSQYSSEDFWTSETNAMLALTAIYRGNIYTNNAEYSADDWWSYNGLLWLELGTDNAYARTGDNATQNQLTSGVLTANLALLANYWNSSYSRIAHCNDFLENIGKVDMDSTAKKRMIAEVRFIRACQYFYMSQYWKSVPLVTTTLSPEEANTVTKAAAADIVNFVINEFSAAAVDLPRDKDIPAAEIGRASKQAALAFLGRIQMAAQHWADAAATYKTIVDFGDDIIDPDYSSIFLESNENSKENIFSIQFLPNVLANGMLKHFAPAIGSGYSLMNPLSSLMEAYQFTDGTPFSYDDPRYDPNNIGKNRDPRLSYTILYTNAPYGSKKYISHPDSASSTDRVGITSSSQTGYGMKKYVDPTFTGNLFSGYGGNIPVIRYPEVLLSYLESELEAGAPIDQALLDATINKVRARPSVNMPSITVTDPVQLRPLLRNERRVELALEGIRYWDLLRWGIADQVLDASFYGEPFPNAKKAIKAKPGSAVDPHKRWYVTTRNFRKGVDEKWPIPQAEVDINPNLGK